MRQQRRSASRQPQPDYCRLPLQSIVDNLTFSRDQVWAYFAVPTVACELLSQSQLLGLQADVAGALGLHQDTDYHLRCAYRPIDPAPWRDFQLRAPQPPPDQLGYGWTNYVTEQAAHLSRQHYHQLEVYLGVCLGNRWGNRSARWWRGYSEQVGLENPVVPDREVAKWRLKADQLASALKQSALEAQPATTRQLVWLVQRSFDPELTEPTPTDPQMVWGDELEALVQYRIDNRFSSRSLIISPGDKEVHLAVLAMTTAPHGDIPDGWLQLGQPHTDVSVRFRLPSAAEASRRLERRLEAANDTLDNAQSTAADVPTADLRKAERIRDLNAAVTDNQEQQCHIAPRLVVTAPSAQELSARVAALQTWYQERFGITWRQRVGQLPFLLESLPGDRQRVAFGTRMQDAGALGGSMFCAAAAVGDRTGPYIGHTVSAGARSALHTIVTPVFWDPLDLAGQRDSTIVVFLGKPGGGKTNAAWLQLYQAVLRGASALYVTCKEETGGLANLRGLQGRLNRISLSDSGSLIRFDPYKIAADSDEAADLAFEVSSLFLGERLDMSRQAALQTACREEAECGTTASFSGMARRLREAQIESTRDMGELLLAVSRHHLGKLAFSTQDATPLLPEGMLTVIEATNLEPPEAGIPLQEQSRDNRISVGLIHLLGYWGKRVASLDRHQPKVIAFDEAHVLTDSALGRRLISRLGRMGRSHNAVLMLISQNAADLYNESVTNNMAAAFAFRSTAETELTQLFQLIGLEDTPANRNMFKSFPKGSGHAVMLDPRGRLVPIKVNLGSEALRQAFDTDPHPELTRPASLEPAALSAPV